MHVQCCGKVTEQKYFTVWKKKGREEEVGESLMLSRVDGVSGCS